MALARPGPLPRGFHPYGPYAKSDCARVRGRAAGLGGPAGHLRPSPSNQMIVRGCAFIQKIPGRLVLWVESLIGRAGKRTRRFFNALPRALAGLNRRRDDDERSYVTFQSYRTPPRAIFFGRKAGHGRRTCCFKGRWLGEGTKGARSKPPQYYSKVTKARATGPASPFRPGRPSVRPSQTTTPNRYNDRA